MKSSNHFNKDMMEHGRVIARAIEQQKVETQKNMMKAVKRRDTMLENAAERVLSK